MKAHWGVEIYLHAFLTLILDESEWSALCPCHFTPREIAPDTHWRLFKSLSMCINKTSNNFNIFVITSYFRVVFDPMTPKFLNSWIME
jgi:hypothetical protein